MNQRILGMVVIAAMLAVVAAAVAADNCDQLAAQAEKLWLARDYNGSDKVLDDAAKQCPKRAELYWRKARNEYDRIENLPRDKKPAKDQLITRYRGIEALAAKCIALDPNDGNCHLWKGIGQGRRGTTQGILSSLREASDLEKSFLKAESLKPQYRAENGSANALGDTYNALGQYYRVVPEWACHIPLLGACGNLQKSVDYQKKAVAREPKRIEYQKELGVSLICHGQKYSKPPEIEEGKKLLQGLAALPNIKPSDEIDKQHAKMLLANPDLACGYSRDAQQEQSQSAYK